jgi:hypothetical protein
MIKLAAFQARGGARMKPHYAIMASYEIPRGRTANRRISNIEPQNIEGRFRFAQSVINFYKNR